ncbi:hypothetical protein EYF80_040369 [Liparis tanakae]|uniref:Uncharacterized protein n=1 Tax=Liparis tanakae TaxID=230148 RepID=A0A4Z2G9B1_9TELE|nr:hypothetical protein EYF80_040369 [Liparis tanakae]
MEPSFCCMKEWKGLPLQTSASGSSGPPVVTAAAVVTGTAVVSAAALGWVATGTVSAGGGAAVWATGTVSCVTGVFHVVSIRRGGLVISAAGSGRRGLKSGCGVGRGGGAVPSNASSPSSSSANVEGRGQQSQQQQRGGPHVASEGSEGRMKK